MQKSSTRNKVSIVISLLFIFFIAAYFINNKDSFAQLLTIPAWSVLIIVIMKYAAISINGLFTKETLRVFKKNISFKQSFYVSLLSAIGNFFGPLLGGTGIRAYYLKSKFNFAYKNFVSTLMGYYIVLFSMGSLLGLIGLWGIYQDTGLTSGLLIIFFIIVILSLLVLMVFNPRLKYRPKSKGLFHKIVRLIDEILNGWAMLKKDNRMVLHFILFSIGTYAIAMITAGIEFSVLNIDFNLYTIALYAALSSLSMLISLTPGALGIREAIFFTFSVLLGLNLEQILQIAVIDRTIGYSVLTISYLFIKVKNKTNLSEFTEI